MCTGSSSEEEASTSQVSNSIDKQLKHEEKKLHSQVKLLLLGSFPIQVYGPHILNKGFRDWRKWQVHSSQGNFPSVFCGLIGI
jgi:hypothetical protein